jgi:hypothetical protein
MTVDRIAVLIGKELRELRSNPMAVLPVVALVVICTLLPLIVVLVIPRITGESLGSDRPADGAGHAAA